MELTYGVNSKPIYVLKMLCEHPEVVRRKNSYLEAIELAKDQKAELTVDKYGWYIHTALKKEKELLVSGTWTRPEERLDFLEHIYNKERTV